MHGLGLQGSFTSHEDNDTACEKRAPARAGGARRSRDMRITYLQESSRYARVWRRVRFTDS